MTEQTAQAHGEPERPGPAFAAAGTSILSRIIRWLKSTAETERPPRQRPAVAIFDHHVTSSNPAGSRHRDLLEDLADEYDFTVYSITFDNPRPDRIRHVRVRVPRRPLVLQYVLFNIMATAIHVLYRLNGRRFDLIMTADTSIYFADIVYAHFCNRSFLKRKPFPVRRDSLHGWLQFINHKLQTFGEGICFPRARSIVAVSSGLSNEILCEFPEVRGRVTIIHNGIDTTRLGKPPGFDRMPCRKQFGLDQTDYVLLFVALGHFERKGLPVVLDSLSTINDSGLKLLVVGGSDVALRKYKSSLRRLGLEGRVFFAGPHWDVRKFLWSADAFVLPSHYEAFSLVGLEAAAAGLPLIIPRLNGIEEMLLDGRNGFEIVQTRESVTAAIRRLRSLSAQEHAAMSAAAVSAALIFDISRQRANWRAHLGTILPPAQTSLASPEAAGTP